MKSKSGGHSAVQGRKILVVDDDPTTRMILRKTLVRAGYEVVEAEDGSDAVEVFRRQPDSFAAVVLDLVMPNLNGFQAFQQLRQTMANVPVLVVSGVPPEEAFRSLVDRRRMSYLKKPIIPDMLLHQLGELLA